MLAECMFVNYVDYANYYANYTIFVNYVRLSVRPSVTKCMPQPLKTFRQPWLALITIAQNIQNHEIK